MKFFHLKNMKHRASNKIVSIHHNSQFLDNEVDIKKATSSFSVEILSNNIGLDFFFQDQFLDVIPNIVTEDLNNMMCGITSMKEIKKVVFSFEGNTTPSLDGFPMLFFQKIWAIISNDVVEATKEFFGSHNLLK